MNKALRSSSLSLLLVSLCACGGNNTASPVAATGNIPALATKPTPQASQLKKVRLTGTVFNSFSGAPIEKAEVLIQILSAAAAPGTSASSAPGSTPVSNAPIPTMPGPDVTSPSTAPATPPPSIAPPSMAPASPVSPASKIPPMVAPVSPTPSRAPSATPVKPPDLPPGDGARAPGAWHRVPGQGWFSARGAQAASFQLAQAEIQPSAKEDELNLFRADSNNKGKFFQNDVPDGRYLLTITAPGYRSLSITDVNVNNQIDVPLTPIEGPKVIDVVGMVLSPSEKPVVDAMVSPSFPLGEAIGVPDTTNQLGEFNLPDVPFGVHSLVAFVMNEDQQIKQMGILPGAPISDTSLKVKHPAMQPGKKPGVHSKHEASAEPGASAEPATRPSGKPTAKPSGKPSDKPASAPSATPPAAASAQPGKPDKPAKPGTSTPASPAPGGQSRLIPRTEGQIQPRVTGPVRFEEHEEKEEDKTYNILDQITELVTGEKPKPDQGVHDFYPVIPLHSVLNQVALAGTVDLPEGYDAKNVEVYLSLPAAKKGDTPEEAYLFSQPLNAPDAAASASPGAASPSPAAAAATPGKKPPLRFRLNLPTLDKGQSYHLQFTASKSSGEISYHHLYNLGKSDEELKVDFLSAAGKIRLEGEEINAVVPVPNFSWDAVTGAEIYHVSLESGNGQARRMIWEAWTKDTQIKFPLTTKAQRLQEQTTYSISVEAVKGLHPASNDIKKQYALPAYQAIWTDLARITHTPFEVVE